MTTRYADGQLVCRGDMVRHIDAGDDGGTGRVIAVAPVADGMGTTDAARAVVRWRGDGEGDGRPFVADYDGSDLERIR